MRCFEWLSLAVVAVSWSATLPESLAQAVRPQGAPAQAQRDSPAKPAQAGLAGFASQPSAVSMVAGFSADMHGASVLLSNLKAEVQGDSQELVNSRVQTVAIPLRIGSGKSRMAQVIEGYVSTRGSGRVSLVVRSGGVSTVVDLPASRVDPATEPATSEAMRKAMSESMGKAVDASPALYRSYYPRVSPRAPGDTSYKFRKRIETDVPAGSTHTVTFVLIAESDQNGEEASVIVQSLEVAVVRPPAASSAK